MACCDTMLIEPAIAAVGTEVICEKLAHRIHHLNAIKTKAGGA
jgi:hypothetical protein